MIETGLIVLLLTAPFVIVIWAYKKRRRLFWNMHFTSETVWLQFQNQNKKNASELINYQQHEEQDDENGELNNSAENDKT